MIRMSVYYPAGADVTFDHAYFADRHRRLVQDRLGPLGLHAVEIERGVAGYGGGPAPYVAVGHLLFPSLDVLQAAWRQAGDAIVADVPRYTNAPPVVQISEIVPA
jgi:uncharacterized protein (TIGR02118 family)